MNTPTRPVQYEEIANFIERHLGQLDADCDGRLSENEIGEAVCRHDWTGRDGLVIAFLHGCYASLLKTDLLLKRNDRKELDAVTKKGINSDTIRRIGALLQERDRVIHASILRSPLWATKVLAISLLLEVDDDKDNQLSRDELIKARDTASVTDTVRPTLEYLIDHFDTICGDDGLIDFGEVWAHFSDTQVEAEFLAKLTEAVLRVMEGRSMCSQRELFPFENSIQPQAIRQGFAQDCLFLAMVASLASVNPDAIRNCIKPLAGEPKKYEVRFPNAQNEPFVINCPTDAELTTFCAATEYGIWPAILEKACGAYCMKSPLRRLAWVRPWNWRPLLGAKEQSRNATYGGWDLFGPASREHIHKLYNAPQFERVLQEQRANGKPAAFANVYAEKRHPQIRPSHAYAFIDYDAESQMVVVYNPWGSVTRDNADNSHGFIHLTLQEAYDTFQVMYRVKP